MSIAMEFAAYGPPEVLQPVEVGTGEPGPGQVRVRMKAAGVQPFDCRVRNGDLAQYMPLTLPSRVGGELAGVVDAVGDGVTSAAVGDEVIGFAHLRCSAEAVVLDATDLVAKPAAMPWDEAGGLSASGQTASTVLDRLGVGPGDTLLVHAAAGGVGSMAVQLAVARGARVVGTAGERNHDYLRSLGATPVTYGPGLADRVAGAAPDGVTAVLDGIGGEALDVSTQLVADRSRIATIADPARAGRLGVAYVQSDRSAARLADLVHLYEKGRLRVFVSHTFPLLDLPAAHREVETGHVRGKVVVTTDP